MSKISNYEELVLARKNAEVRITMLKSVINEDVEEVKQKLQPFLRILPVLNIFRKEGKGSPLLKGAASLGIDLIIGQNLLARAGWFTKLIVPIILKSFSSKVIDVTKK